MMTLKDIRDAYEALSGTMSSIVRQINFAGIAIAWIFVDKENHQVSQLLINSCLFIVSSIVLDALQYFVGTIIWHFCYCKKHEKSKKDEDIEVNDSEWINGLAWLLFYAKCIITGIGYFYILLFFILQFNL